MQEIRLHRAVVAALALFAFFAQSMTASVGHAGVVLPEGFNILAQAGDGPVWEAVNNPGDFNVSVGDLTMISGQSSTDTWSAAWGSIAYTQNPSLTTAWAFTNTTNQTQTFTVTFVTPGSIAGPTVMHGSITGGLTDTDGTGAQFSAPMGGAVYTALIDGSPVAPTLFNDPHNVATSPPTQTAPLGFEFFENEPGPGVLADIGIQHTFTLSAGDSVTFNSAFAVIPAPGVLAVLGGLALIHRRRRRETH